MGERGRVEEGRRHGAPDRQRGRRVRHQRSRAGSVRALHRHLRLRHDPEKWEPVFRKRSCLNRLRVEELCSMPIQVLMPALSPTMEKGNLSKWLKQEGDKVKSGDVIAEIETDKATMEVEAVDEGTLGKILVPEGTNDVAVNTPIATILSEGEDASAASPPAKEANKPAQQQKAAESAPPAGKETVEQPKKAPSAAAPPQPKLQLEPDVPEGTEMVSMT